VFVPAGLEAVLLGLFLSISCVGAETKPFFEEQAVFQQSPSSPLPRYGIPAIDRMPNGDLLCVAYGDDYPTNKVKGVVLGRISKDGGRTWGKVFTIIEDNKGKIGYGDPSIVVAGNRVTVISTGTSDAITKLRRTVWTARSSTDNGETWGAARDIPMIHKWNSGNVHHALVLRNGTVLRPYAYDLIVERFQDSATEGEMVSRASVLASNDDGQSWQQRGEVGVDDPRKRPSSSEMLDESTAVELADRSVWMLIRTLGGPMLATVSQTYGKTWSKPQTTPIVSCGAPAALHRLSWTPSKILVAWNNSPSNRWPLDIAVSYDDCKSWTFHRTVVNRALEHKGAAASQQFQTSYPSITSTSDGTIVMVWQEFDPDAPFPTRKSIHCARLNEAWIRQGKPLPVH
jgi:hypothetical protein